MLQPNTKEQMESTKQLDIMHHKREMFPPIRGDIVENEHETELETREPVQEGLLHGMLRSG